MTAGTYHVVVKSAADPSKQDTATVDVTLPSSTDTTGLLPLDRVTTWNPGLNTVGGIPSRTTIYTTLSPSGGDDTMAIQAAVDSCPPEQVVQLGPGDYHFGQVGQINFRSKNHGARIGGRQRKANHPVPIGE
jgi:hypothetical protein